MKTATEIPASKIVLVTAAELAAEQARLNELKNLFETQRDERIKNLPVDLSFTDAHELIENIARVHGIKVEARAGRKSRVSLTDEQKEAVKTDFKAGMKSEEIIAKYGISSATAQTLKKEAGMVKTRGEAPEAPEVAAAPVVPALPVAAPTPAPVAKSTRKASK